MSSWRKVLIICLIPVLFLLAGTVSQTWKHSGTPTKLIFCLEADSKPTTDASGDVIPAGSELIETDTGDKYEFNGSSWVQIQPPMSDNNSYMRTVVYNS